MNWLQAVVLGIVQGLTEFLPISSSAHLRLVATWAGWPDPGAAFTAVTQVGTEAAVIVFFRRDIAHLTTGWLRSLIQRTRNDEDKQAARLAWFVILGTIPIGVLGVLLQDRIEHSFRSLWLVGTALIVFGIALGVADRLAVQRRGLSTLTAPHALALGTAQCLALIPGVSRSGGTITAALLLGYTRQEAARYSFLLALPAVLASGALEATTIATSGEDAAPWWPTLLATAIAFAVGYATIAWLMRFISTHRFTPFVCYRILIGTAVLLALTMN